MTFCLMSFGQTKVDNSIFAVLPYNSSEHWIFNNCKNAQLNDNEYIIIESLLEKCVTEYNFESEKRFNEITKKYPNYKFNKNNYIIDLKEYKRQYIAVTNDKGEKEVWINCFCDNFDSNWKKVLMLVDDGGKCFFNLKINLTTGKYYDFRVNGLA